MLTFQIEIKLPHLGCQLGAKLKLFSLFRRNLHARMHRVVQKQIDSKSKALSERFLLNQPVKADT